ncbi:uncharacterized protein [Littorina saxatilis]|uniref:uncharacterized protein n=1 Tax=Littorina saxatilis TaxID=31220 RepID=UPI0038B5D222
MSATHPVNLCLLMLFTTVQRIQSTPCINIKITNNPVITEDQSEVTLAFTVSNTCGIDVSTVKILVKEDKPPHTTACVFFHDHGTCIPSNGCTCGEGTGDYTVTKRMDGSEMEMELVVKLADGQSFEKSVGVAHEQYPPHIESIALLYEEKAIESPIPQNSPITIVCTWDRGYPLIPSLPRLKDHHGQQLAVTHKAKPDNEVRHTMDSVQCEDAGQIVCETEDGGSNMSTTLLVKCPPSFNQVTKKTFSVAPGERLDLSFPVRSHAHISVSEQCKLEKDTPHGTLTFKSCHSSDRAISLTGEPPDMTLHLSFIGVTSESHGTYRLCLTNDLGVGHIAFMVDVVETDIQTTPSYAVFQSTDDSTTEPDTQRPQMGMVVGIIVGFLLLLIGIIVAVCYVLKKRASPAPPKVRRASGPGTPLPLPPGLVDMSGSKNSVHSHVYDEIPDNETNEADESNDYLTPMPSAEDRAADQQNPTTGPNTTMVTTPRRSSRAQSTMETRHGGDPGNAERATSSQNASGLYDIPRAARTSVSDTYDIPRSTGNV